jgi:opacity protein-like surface antigen
MTAIRTACLVTFTFALVATATASGAQSPADASRLSVEFASGTTVGGPASRAIIGGEGELRVASAISIVVDAGHVGRIGTNALDARASRIATAVGLTSIATYDVTHVGVGIRVRAPAIEWTQPYADGGVGVARVRTETAFLGNNGVTVAPGARGIALGPDLQGSTTKRMVTAGAGLTFALARQLFGDVGARYSRILARTSELPNDARIVVVRLQAGVGVRF